MDLIVLADAHLHHSVQAWPVVGILLLAGLCALVFLLTRRRPIPQPFAPQLSASSGDGREPPSRVPPAPTSIGSSGETGFSADDYDFDAKILAMLNQKGAPMLQSEIAANLDMKETDLATWLASMEQREMVQRTWDRKRSTYVIQLPAS